MLKKAGKRYLAMLLSIIMVIALLPALEISALAANVSTGITTLTGTYSGKGTWTYNSSAKTITGSIPLGSSYDSCTGITSYYAQENTLTLKNIGSAAILSFRYALTLNGGSCKIDGVTMDAPGLFTKKLAPNESIDIYVKTSDSDNPNSEVVLSEIALTAVTNVTTTFAAPVNGSYTVDGAAIAHVTDLTNSNDHAYAVSAAPASGYEFVAWLKDGEVISANAQDSLMLLTAGTVEPRFEAENTPVFQVGQTLFTDLNEANSYAASHSLRDIILIKGGTLPAGDYTITSGRQLLIPFDKANTVSTSEPIVIFGSYTTPTAFRILDMQPGANITVKSGGAICVNSVLSSYKQMGGYNGTPTGPNGRIHMFTGSNINLESGANLYCWGYIYGGGSVTANSGSTVYEAFQIKDWRGGSATSSVVDYAFIFNQYYVQSIEVPLKVYSGASVKLYSSVNASSTPFPIGATLISGTNGGGMFKLSSGYIVKDYSENDDRLNIEVNGTVTLASLTITGVPSIGTVSTSDFRLPINNMRIDIQNGEVSLDQDLEILPGSEIYVRRGATFEVSSGKNVFLFDQQDWGNFTGTAKLYPVGYSVANGTTAIRTAANLSSAKIDVNGMVSVLGSLFTSEHGADITSTEGTEDTEGQIIFTTAPSTNSTTIDEMADNKTRTPVTFYPPMLHNGDDTYSRTISTGMSTWKYDKPGEHWYRYLVDFEFANNLISRRFFDDNGTTVIYDASWLENLGASVTSGSANAAVSGTNVNVSSVSQDSVVTLTGTPKEYIPTFVLNEHEYGIYRFYTGSELPATTVNGETYYIVKQSDTAMAVGADFAAPTDAEMGVTEANHNSIIWNMSGLSYTSGDPYRGIVPAGATAQGPTYIYGFYDGVVAYNSATDKYYKTLADAWVDVPQDGVCTVRLVADCGTFEEENAIQNFPVPKETSLTFDLNGYNAVGRITNNGTLTLELNGGTLDYVTGATAAAAGYNGKAAVTNSGTMTIQDSVGGGKITTDAIAKDSGFANYADVVRNDAGGDLTVTGVTLEHKQTVNDNSTVLLNYGTASISDSFLTTKRGMGIGNSSSNAIITSLTNTTVSVTLAAGSYGIYNNAGAAINMIDNCELSTVSSKNVLYNLDGATVTTLHNTRLTITAPAAKNVYVILNYGGTITTIDGCEITGNSGINNRNKRGSNTIAQGYNIAYYGHIGTIHDTTVTVGQYALYNGGTVGTISGTSKFMAQPASAQVPWPSGTAALNGNSVNAITIYNSNTWWYDSAVWKRTDTTVDNNGTSMLQRRVDQYKTTDEFMPTIGTITDDVEIIAYNTSTSNSYGYFALQNMGVINEISGSVSIRAEKHPDNAKTVYGYYAVRNEAGGKINTIGENVTIWANNYALANIGARYSQTDTTYSTTYLDGDGKLKSGGLATDYDYTYANVSTIGSTAATVTATSQYAILNYSKIGSITGTISGNYNVIVNAGAANTTTGIEGTTANARAIEHRYFENNDSSTTDNEYRRYFEYTRNTTDGCYIGSINATVTATGAGYQAISNQGYIGTIAGTVSTPTGKATSGSTYYPLIYNGNQRQATLKQDEYYYIETNDAGATKYLREYTYEVPTIGTISCTATNPQDYTIQNYGQINNLTGTISGKTITVANEAAGPFLTRKTITFYSSTSRFAASKGSSEVNYEYTKQPAEITNITGATITASHSTASNGKTALRNYGYIGTITGSTITSSSTDTIVNGSSTITEYTSNRLDVLTGCVPNGSTSCALNYDTTQTINENEVRVVGTIDTIGAGNYIQGTGNGINNTGRINTIDSGTGATTIIYTSGNATNVYNYDGQYTRRTNTAAELTNTTGTLTNHYTYDYAPAYIGTIKNVFILGKRNAILNGAGKATYDPVTIGEIGKGAELRTSATATYSAVQNNAANAKIELISGGVFMTGNGSGIYGLNNLSTTYPIEITGGDFRGGNATRALAISDADNTAKYTYSGQRLSDDTENATYHTLSNKVLTAKTTGFYYLVEVPVLSFDMQGHGTAPEDQNVVSGQTATQPETPALNDVVTEENLKYRFDGWFTDDSFATAFDFAVAITEDTTAYAKWTLLRTVTFNANGHGTAPEAIDVEDGSKITAPTAPTADGWEFGGWYKEEACENAWDFGTDTVTADTTLYAKWTVAGYHVSIADYVTDGDGGYDFETTLVEGTYTATTFTVYCEKACIVLWAPDSDEEDLTRVIGEEVEDDTYEFTIEGFSEDITVYIILKGDIDLNGIVDLDDYDLIEQSMYPPWDSDFRDLNALEAIVADLDQSDVVDLDDYDLIEQSMYPPWDSDYADIAWDMEV